MRTFIVFIGLLVSSIAFSQSGNNWLKDIPDNTPIADINLPGSHDAAAINKKHHTPYACHYTTIPEQLESGIRVLDIRIKVKGSYSNYSFVTCHGKAFGGKWHLNEYQSLASVLDECSAFLKNYPSEFVVMMLQIDDWDGKDQQRMYRALDSLVFSSANKYPIYNVGNNKLPLAAELRGKIYLLNRISDAHEFGVPVKFPFNKADTVKSTESRHYPMYIQDHYSKLGHPAEVNKLHEVEQTFTQKKKGDGTIVLNYASGRQGFHYLYKVFIEDSILNYFGSLSLPERPTNFGWLMMDYESYIYPSDKYGNMNLLKLIIASNFGYTGYTEKFKVSGKHRQ